MLKYIIFDISEFSYAKKKKKIIKDFKITLITLLTSQGSPVCWLKL